MRVLDAQSRAVFVRTFDAGYLPDDARKSPGSHDDTAIEVRDLSVAYGGRLALAHLSGRFEPASMTAIVGPNGAGKSSLLKALARVVRSRAGAIACPARRTRRLAYLPQLAELDRSFPITVGELVALGGWRSFGAFRSPPGALAARVAEAIETLGLTGQARRQIAELSAGQFQRALFARLLVQDAAVILLDEPFAAIDERTTDDLLRLLHRWHGERRTVIAVLHDIEQVRAHFPATLLLARECIAWGDTAAVLTPHNLARARQALEPRLDPTPRDATPGEAT